MENCWNILVATEQEQLKLGAALAKFVLPRLVIYLTGDLGAGKTTLSRGILTGFGYQGKVKSPTYTLVEPYEFETFIIYHFDLYRLVDPEELELLGIRDYFHDTSIVLIEWPTKGQPLLPEPDIRIDIKMLTQGRQLCLTAHSLKGQQILQQLCA
ncbi:tRNA (adenosine(37)-N6)-threonylcarbamoyltransferase complex ATPase subunit type 1 TsaE [Agitococcus lubricus]|uniref:tRNA (adenosine(37)-N6)-threonylcarbamoyltransferase complex ATPase subunit type 1 TsaE n=1 Tax=Agitococcus lubricus TaxID=1077255 RepID=UPI003B848B11